ncbi:hypothetical protein [Photobacterium lutimaris]|uniref:Lipoprotein n=1 Tax=Photobacterium lutimaris TaxID=388278 RepID=A0A2T3IYQ4_9GAMM|nr:hypothetical protein [Photobacterium lutimaris]PSU33727.1 hypothetical protein C9I99_13255 [Photobacterium lutimaris]TDR74414.1 hypothetical protein DFP78_1071 [Photobacterium lutimaris]
MKFNILILLAVLSGCKPAPTTDLEELFGIHIGKPLPEEYSNTEVTEYPTKLLSIKINSHIDLAEFFHNISVQVIASDNRVYSITAEREIVNMTECQKKHLKLSKILDRTYKDLRQHREVELGGKVRKVDDGYRSLDGRKHLRTTCSITDKDVVKQSISLWETELANYSKELWDEYLAQN